MMKNFLLYNSYVLQYILFVSVGSILFVSCGDDDEFTAGGVRPVPEFSSNKQQVQIREDVQFTDESERDPEEWYWTFEGGTPETSTDQNPVVYWEEEGTYSVTLSVSNEDGTQELTKDNYIEVEFAAEEKNMSIVNNMTATWCFSCGSWGWSMFNKLISDYSDDAVMIGTYYSSDDEHLYASVARSIQMNLHPDLNDNPVFLTNGEDVMVRTEGGGINGSASEDNITDAIINHAASPVTANVAFLTDNTGNELIVESITEFFQPVSGTFRLAFYVLEDRVTAPQMRGDQEWDHNASHRYVLRGVFGNDAFGQQFASGSLNAGATFTDQHEISIDNDWDADNLRVAAVIWKEDNGNYEFVNANW